MESQITQLDQEDNKNVLNWENILKNLPYEPNNEDNKRRIILFNKLDKRKTGFLTLKDLLKVKKYLKFEQCVLSNDAINRSFNTIVSNNPSTKVVGNVDITGFRYFFYCLHQYFEYYITMYGEQNFQKNQQVKQENFMLLQQQIEKRNIEYDIKNETFEQLQKQCNEFIIYDEFVKILLEKSLLTIPQFEEENNEGIWGIINEEDEHNEFSQDYSDESLELDKNSSHNSDDVFEQQKKQNKGFYNNYTDYLEKTGIREGFEIIFNEIIAENIEEEHIFQYTVKRLNELGKQLQPFLEQQNYEFIRPNNNKHFGSNTNR